MTLQSHLHMTDYRSCEENTHPGADLLLIQPLQFLECSSYEYFYTLAWLSYQFPKAKVTAKKLF